MSNMHKNFAQNRTEICSDFCVSAFRVYVSERVTDTYPVFWKRFSPSRQLHHSTFDQVHTTSLVNMLAFTCSVKHHIRPACSKQDTTAEPS